MAEGISDCLKLLYELLQEADDASRLQAANIVYVLAGSMQVLQSKIDELDEDE